MDIGNFLEKVIQNTGYSKTKFAKELDISKSFMLRVIKGEKKVSETMMLKLLNSSIISNYDKDILAEKYYANLFGSNNFNKITTFIEHFKSFNTNCNISDISYIRSEFLESALYNAPYPHTIGGKEEFFEIVSFFCEKTLQNPLPFFYSNYSFEQKHLNDILYNYFSKRNFSKPFDFVHLTHFANGITNYEISAVFEALKWGKSLLNTYYADFSSLSDNDMNVFFIITNDCTITFNFDCSQGLVITHQPIIQYCKKNFTDAIPKYKPLCTFVKDEFDFIDKDIPLFGKHLYSLVSYMCIGPLLTEDALRELKCDTLTNSEQLIKMFINHYSNMDYDTNSMVLIPPKVLDDFATTGNLNFISDKYIKNCPNTLRRQILELIKTSFFKNDMPHYKIAVPGKLDFPDNVNIDIYSNRTLITSLFNDSQSNVEGYYNITISLDTSHIYPLFKDLYTYLSKNNFMYTDTVAGQIIDKLILKHNLSN